MNIIVAASENLAIGYQGQMPWHLGADLRYFKQTTLGHPVVMGRKTYESIGRPLPGRHNIVVTRDADYCVAPEVLSAMKEGTRLTICTGGLDEAIAMAGPDAFIIGGAQIYNQAWPMAQRIYLTRVHATVEQFDASIPPVPEGFRLVSSQEHPADEKNDYAMTFEVWERK